VASWADNGCRDLINFLEPAGDARIAGEGALELSPTAEVGHVPGSQSFADRYRQRYGPIGNYAINSYDTARVLIAAIEQRAISRAGRRPASR
jgi:branched-chain amino acid transport system substrate-binding protein